MHELGLSIALSKINTEGTRVADVFYVSELGERGGAKVARGPRYGEIHDALGAGGRQLGRGLGKRRRRMMLRTLLGSSVSAVAVSVCGGGLPAPPASPAPGASAASAPPDTAALDDSAPAGRLP